MVYFFVVCRGDMMESFKKYTILTDFIDIASFEVQKVFSLNDEEILNL